MKKDSIEQTNQTELDDAILRWMLPSVITPSVGENEDEEQDLDVDEDLYRLVDGKLSETEREEVMKRVESDPHALENLSFLLMGKEMEAKYQAEHERVRKWREKQGMP